MTPFVSVIIPVYNAEKYLRECLDSVVNQTLRDIEIICVDDGSTDSSPAVLAEYAARDSRVRVLTQENRYAGAARNAGMKIARGDYLSFLDADDVFDPDMLRKMFLDADARDADVVICRADRFSDSLEARTPVPWTVRTELLDVPATTVFSYKNFRRDAFTFCIGWTWDKLFSRRFIEEQGLSFSETRSTNDAYFTFLAVIFARRISFVDRVFVHQRVHADSLSCTREKDPLCYWQVVRDMKRAILARPGLWDEVGDAFMRWLAKFALWQAESLAPDARERQIAYFRDVAAPEFDFLAWLNFNAFTPEMRRVRSWLTDTPPPPLVSVIIPVYNVEKYLRQCLDSVVNQTLRDIEIICVNDGSTDSSLKILEEYASRDSRINIISRENKGYGFSVNEGIDSSHGRYIGIIEPDDFAELSMYEKLVGSAQEFNIPWVICFHYLYEEGKRRPCYQYNSWRPSKPILLSPKTNTDCVIFGPAIWAAIYDRRWLNENNIRCLESPGASFQDTGFSIKCFLTAETVLYIPEMLINYRISNPNSSVKDQRKLLCVFDEFEEIERWMEMRKISSKEKWALVLRRKLYVYKWNEFRVDVHSRQELFEKSRLEFSESLKRFHGERPEGIPATEWTEILCRVKNIPLVSVVIPVYNAERYLCRCLDSIVNQTLCDIEIICVNDGSTDGSPAILEKYAAKDSRVKVIKQVNAGAAKARDAGIQFAKGKYIGFVDADDYIDSNFYEKLFSAAVKNGLAIAKADIKRVVNGVVEETTWSANSFIEKKQGELPLFARFYYQFTSAIYDSELLKKNKICFADENFLVGEDVLFLLKVCQKEESVVLVPDVFYYYVKNESSVTHVFSKAYFDDNLNYVERGIDLLNSRGICDDGYYSWIHGRFVQVLKVVLPQIDENTELSDYKPEFLARVRALAKKVNGIEKFYKTFLDEIPLYELLVNPDSPLVSVVVPVYNTGKYLRECLDSICGQTLRNIEIICVNDGSTDGSLSILEEYAARDPRVRVFSQENFGQGHARNVGLSHGRGEYVYFMDSDDCLPLAALQKEYACAKAADLDVLLFEGESMYESKELEERFPAYKTLYLRKGDYPGVLSGTQAAVLLKKNRAEFVSPCCFFSKRDFLVQNKLRFPEGYFYEDNVFFFALLKAAGRVAVVHEKLFIRRVREGSTMTKPIGFQNFFGYASVVAELEKLAREGSDDGFKKVLSDTSAWMSRAIAGYYEAFSPEDRARSRELLSGALKNSAWLDVVRERIDKIDTEENEVQVTARETARPAAGTAEAPASAKKIYPAVLVRLGAAFILNKAARKRWRERHMDLTPKDGIDVNAHPELRRDSELKRFAVRAASLFIFSKKKRKAFRAKHLNLRPRDGVDVRELSSKELARLREAKRSRSTLWRVFDALVPATRGKIAHTERHLRRAAEEQTRILIDELRRMHDENRRAFDESRRVVDENRRALGAVRAELKTVRERADALSRELAASKTELKDRTLATERALRAELSATREALTLKTLAAKHAALDAESNLQARLGEVLESLNAARSEFAQAAAETVRAVNARADALPRMFEEALARNAESTKSALLAAKTELCASVESAEKQLREALSETGGALAREQEKAAAQTNASLAALSESVPESETRVLAAVDAAKSALGTGKIDKIAKTSTRVEAWMNYCLLCDAFPEFRERLRERNPLASREIFDELFRTGADSPRIVDYRNWQTAQIRSAFAYKNAAYYERVPAEARERELKLWFKLRTGRDLDLKHPKTFNEKIQWLKLYDVSPLKTRLADKFEVREWIREKIGEKYLTPLIGVYDTFDEIDFDRLPDKFVLKTTHGSGYNIVVKDKSRFDKADAKKKFDDWLSRKFEYQAGFEMHYAGMKPRIIAEEFLDIDESGFYEWQAFCFNGEAKFFLVIVGGAHDSTPGKRFYYSPKWEKLPFTSLARELPEGAIPCPDNFAELAECVKKLCDGFLHVRVDFYRLRDGNWKFGEMTFSTASGLWAVYPEEYDRVVGDMLTLPAEGNPEK